MLKLLNEYPLNFYENEDINKIVDIAWKKDYEDEKEKKNM